MHFSAEQFSNLHRLAPEIILCLFGIVIMLLDPFLGRDRQRVLGWVAFLGTLAAAASLRLMYLDQGYAYNELIRADLFSIFAHAVVIGAAALCVLGAINYLDDENLQRGEFYALVLFATAGMGILAGANELLTAFVGLEISSISSYILAGFRKRATKSNESSLKYFILGSFATAFFLSGLALIFVGLVFKVVAAPFHIYGPDVYEGAPTPVTALLASAPKVATFALMLRIFYVSFAGEGHFWFWAIWVSAVLTMFVGNLAAIVQTNVKRMLAYSSIAHAGYILVAFAASTDIGVAAVLFYLAAYVLMKVGAFLVLTHLGQQGEKRLEIQDYGGLGSKQPVLAVCFSLFLLSLLGLPATGGFLGKFFAFQAALDSRDPRFVWLVVIAAINSVIGAYYYLRVIVVMYFS